ncbi:MAG: hypothetical protein ABL308_11150 [Oceanicaulis sp.]
MRGAFRFAGWLAAAGALADLAALGWLLAAGLAFEAPLARFLASGPSMLDAAGAGLSLILPEPVWREVAGWPAGPLFACRAAGLAALALVLLTATRSRSADS